MPGPFFAEWTCDPYGARLPHWGQRALRYARSLPPMRSTPLVCHVEPEARRVIRWNPVFIVGQDVPHFPLRHGFGRSAVRTTKQNERTRRNHHPHGVANAFKRSGWNPALILPQCKPEGLITRFTKDVDDIPFWTWHWHFQCSDHAALLRRKALFEKRSANPTLSTREERTAIIPCALTYDDRRGATLLEKGIQVGHSLQLIRRGV